MHDAPRLVVREVETGVRPVHLRLPFRFGNTTLQSCPQVFLRATVEVIGVGVSTGHSAEMMVPGWFDKRSTRSPRDNIADLAESIRAACEAYAIRAPCSAFELFARNYDLLVRHGQDVGMTTLSAGFGAAVLDRAVLDALCRAAGATFVDAMTANVMGIGDCAIAADMIGFDWSGWLAGRAPLPALSARHTVGILDEVEASTFSADGLPASLPAAVERYGHRDFKIKLAGNADEDIRRLASILDVLEEVAPGHRFSLDGNEQFPDRDALEPFTARVRELAVVRRRPAALLYLEQPVPRDSSFDETVPATRDLPWLLDEADGLLDAFPAGAALGWTGISSKGCKGIYKSLINRARCDAWNSRAGQPRFFMSAEDLCCQAGVGVQQDLAMASFLGMRDAERNGHHYADGMLGTPLAEQRGFVAAHPDLYESSAGHARLRIAGGTISIRSLLTSPGFACAADPAVGDMRGLADVSSML